MKIRLRGFTFLAVVDHLSPALNGRNIPFVNTVKYVGVILGKKVTWRIHTEMIEVKTFRTFIRIYYLFESERLSSNIKLTLRKALVNVMTYAWEFAAGNYLLKLHRPRNRVLRTTGNLSRRTPFLDMHLAFKLP
jgi:hypothetical protein